MAEGRIRILVVDDDESDLRLIERSLRGDEFEVTTCSSPIGVTNLVRSSAPDIVLMDVNIPALSGDRLLAIARKTAPAHTRFYLRSACDESTLRALAKEVEADGWISKGVVGMELMQRLRKIGRAPKA